MYTLQIPISDKIIERIGINALKEHFLKEMEYLYFEKVAQSIEEEIIQSKVNNDEELEKSRQDTWETYKEAFLKGIA